jgi:hypothetical protein
MVIAKKPVLKNKFQKTLLIESIISKGGSVSSIDKPNQEIGNIKITLRLPKKMLIKIDEYLLNCSFPRTRNHWVKEAIEKKMKHEIDEKE